MLERGLYLLVCFTFNHWHTNSDDPSLHPQCVLVIHSSKRFLVEQIVPPPFILADAIISLTLAEGQQDEGREGVTIYHLHKVNMILISFIENLLCASVSMKFCHNMDFDAKLNCMKFETKRKLFKRILEKFKESRNA